MAWHQDKDADEWAKKHRTEDCKEKLENPRNSYPIELASRLGRVTLSRSEWKTLQRFLVEHEHRRDLLPKDYAHLPAKVRVVVHDWVSS